MLWARRISPRQLGEDSVCHGTRRPSANTPFPRASRVFSDDFSGSNGASGYRPSVVDFVGFYPATIVIASAGPTSIRHPPGNKCKAPTIHDACL